MRQYLVLRTEDHFQRDYRADKPDALCNRIFGLFADLKAPDHVLGLHKAIKVVATPSLTLRATIEKDPEPDHWPKELIVSFTLPDRISIDRLRQFVAPYLGDGGPPLKNIGADPVGHICALQAAQARPFGNRRRVREMMGIEELRRRGLKGRGVNVVIFDQGLNKDEIVAHHPGSWGGGLGQRCARSGYAKSTPDLAPPEPGSAPRTSHGMMMARNVLDVAPEAKLYDVPLIPPRISSPSVFASTAHATYLAVLDDIIERKKKDPGSSWILVNAWAIFDRTGENPEGDYTQNLHKVTNRKSGETVLGHPLNELMTTAVDEDIDVVFGAGNCGQFTSSTRCGKHDRGEGHSIWGANAHPDVLTVGAVSANDTWLGYSSQGPAAWGGALKPDLCTPSHFSEDDDASTVNSGTSAATGLAAGVIAAIRGNHAHWAPKKLTPRALKGVMNATARGQNGVWNERTGHGILDADTLLKALR